MRNADVLKWAQSTGSGKSIFRNVLSIVNDFDVCMQIVINDRRLKETADAINETVKSFEPAAIGELRKRAQGLKDDELDEINKEYNRVYGEFWLSKPVQDFLKSESDVNLKIVALPENFKKRVIPNNAVDLSETIEALMLFTDVKKDDDDKPKTKKR